eukprot:m.147677 g.147677  ORF g.147677 m.147677 type:complete len:129 (-) comp14989_c0_seq7:269-655(-)
MRYMDCRFKDLKFNVMWQAVIHSISQIAHDLSRSMMYQSILLVGGCAQIPGLRQMLQEKILERLPKPTTPDMVAITTKVKTIDDSRLFSWHGGAILSMLPTIQEHWISQESYKVHGVRTMREKGPFLW